MFYCVRAFEGGFRDKSVTAVATRHTGTPKAPKYTATTVQDDRVNGDRNARVEKFCYHLSHFK